jgi:hypothetical protein
MACTSARQGFLVALIDVEFGTDRGVVAVDEVHQRDGHRHREHDQVRAVAEFGDHHDDKHDAGEAEAERVDRPWRNGYAADRQGLWPWLIRDSSAGPCPPDRASVN